MAFLNTLPGAVAQGLIWGLMAIGVYLRLCFGYRFGLPGVAECGVGIYSRCTHGCGYGTAAYNIGNTVYFGRYFDAVDSVLCEFIYTWR